MARSLDDLPPRRALLDMRDRIKASFDAGDWRELQILTECDYIGSHSRLLRSLSFGDEDYGACVLDVLDHMYTRTPRAIFEVEEFLNKKYPETATGENVSSAVTTGKKIVFNPLVFQVPEGQHDTTLISVMMPFSPAFNGVFDTISATTRKMGLTCQRASDIWEHSTVIQDIFSLIFRSAVVICDFTGKNPNVFYEAGIAHTLGKHVIPITQNGADVPFDLAHHRYLPYLNNGEGLARLGEGIEKRLWQLNVPF